MNYFYYVIGQKEDAGVGVVLIVKIKMPATASPSTNRDKTALTRGDLRKI